MDAAAHHRPSEVRRLVVHLVIRLSFLGRSLARGRFSHEVTRHRTMPRETGPHTSATNCILQTGGCYPLGRCSVIQPKCQLLDSYWLATCTTGNGGEEFN